MDGKMLARLGAIIFVAIAITATVIEMTREDEPAQPHPAPALQATRLATSFSPSSRSNSPT